MESKKKFSYALLAFGELIIIAAWLYFGKNLGEEILVLNIVVSTAIYASFFYDIINPLAKIGDPAQKQFGGLGVRWFFSAVYAILAIAAIYFLNFQKHYIFIPQLICHSVLFFGLLLGFLASRVASDKVTEVQIAESQQKIGLQILRTEFSRVKMLAGQKGLSTANQNQIFKISENLQYVSPSNKSEATDLENQFLKNVYTLSDSMQGTNMDEDKISSLLADCERILNYRKQIHT